MKRRIAVWMAVLVVLVGGIGGGFLVYERVVRGNPVSIDRLRTRLETSPEDVELRAKLANALWDQKAVAEAIVVMQDGLKRAPKDKEFLYWLARAYSNWAYQDKDKHKQHKYEKAAQYWQQLLDAGCKDEEVYRELARALDASDQRDKLLRASREAAMLYPASSEMQIALVDAMSRQGRYEEAGDILRDLAKRFPDDPWVWHRTGLLQYFLGDYATAHESLTHALGLAKEDSAPRIRYTLGYLKDLQRPERSELAFFRHHGLAVRMRDEHRPDRCAAESEAALQHYNGDRDYYCPAGWAARNVDEFAQYIGKFDKALDFARLAIECYEKKDNVSNMAYAYQDIANTYYSMWIRDMERKDYLEQCLHAFEKEEEMATKAGNEHMARHALSSKVGTMAKLYGLTDERTTAGRREMAALLPEKGPVSDCSFRAITEEEAHMKFDEKDYAGAARLYGMIQDSYWGNHSIGELNSASQVFNRLAAIADLRGDFGAARTFAERSLERQDMERAEMGADDLRRRVTGRTPENSFKTLIHCAIEEKDYSRSFNYSEEYKGRALLDLLGTKSSAIRDDSVFAVAKVPAPRLKDTAGFSASQESAPGAQRDLAVEQTAYDRIAEDKAVAERRVPSYRNVPALGLDELKFVLDGLTFVTYAMVDERLYIITAGEDGVHPIDGVEIKDKDLRAEVDQLRKAIGVKSSIQRDLQVEADGERKAEAAVAEVSFEEASAKLYERLVAPIEPFLKTKLVCISPDSVLNYVPFEALGKDGKYLIDDHAVFYAPSANILKRCMDLNRTKRESVLALGNPNLRNPAFRLVHAEEEAAALDGLFPRVNVLTFDGATETAVKAMAGQYDILHFACHGELNPDDAMLTSLRLAPDDQNDGYLHAGEVFDLSLDASLVVLSACNSAIGDLTSGNELMGLTRSFLYAGAPSIVASLWTVDDKSTAALMQAFYKNLASMNKAEALREAKRTVRKEFPSPFHWAPFLLQGDYR